ncbi:hypothetical protein FIBSPDRAFT_952943 [Athelia psychrophila]|uniref:Uncharacterized protein n=1 Tax=Athelia psychrophila TaxID=1759441 RepID=A0A166KWN2_9AGAM|nr:hypothetical protein FIBSPDRAFT_952943 [Fibularhizoctonia sp. CBS 109695]
MRTAQMAAGLNTRVSSHPLYPICYFLTWIEIAAHLGPPSAFGPPDAQPTSDVPA